VDASGTTAEESSVTILGGLAWRLAILTGPILRDTLQHFAWCHRRTGMIGSCQPRRGRCTTCHRTRP
jgi:hypothetical protein